MFEKVKKSAVTKAEQPKDNLTMNVEEMARELHISRPIAYELVRQEDFPSFRIGNRILVSRAGLAEWIEKQIKTKGNNR